MKYLKENFWTLLIIALVLVPNPVDDSDKDFWDRSGLHLHTDYRTCLQYVTTRSFLGLIKSAPVLRLDHNGQPVLAAGCKPGR